MIPKVKNKLKKLLSRGKELNTSVHFPGGVEPISNTKPHDVFIVGFPKSGNTLMQHIIAHLYYGLNQEAGRSMVNLIAPDIYANSHYFRFGKTCFFKSHDLPQPRYRRVIYLVRDGREAMLSYYHMIKNMGREVRLEDLYLGKVKLFGALWHEHIAQWESNPYQAAMLILKYEDLKDHKKEMLRKACVFLEIDRSDDELDKVCELTSFEHMKSLERRSDWKKKIPFVPHSSFVRKGNGNSYKEEISSDLIRAFEKENSAYLRKYHYL